MGSPCVYSCNCWSAASAVVVSRPSVTFASEHMVRTSSILQSPHNSSINAASRPAESMQSCTLFTDGLAIWLAPLICHGFSHSDECARTFFPSIGPWRHSMHSSLSAFYHVSAL